MSCLILVTRNLMQSRLLHNKDKEKLSTPDIMELKAYVNLSETYIYDLKMSFSLP